MLQGTFFYNPFSSQFNFHIFRESDLTDRKLRSVTPLRARCDARVVRGRDTDPERCISVYDAGLRDARTRIIRRSGAQ